MVMKDSTRDTQKRDARSGQTLQKSAWRELFFRPHRRGMPGLLWAVRSCGHYRVGADYTESGRRPDFWEIFWSLAGRGLFRIKGRDREIGPGEWVWLKPGEEHRFRTVGGAWQYRWMTLDGRGTERLLKRMGFGRQGGPAACPEADFQALGRWVPLPHPAAERAASAVAYRILLAAGAGDASAAGLSAAERCRLALEEGFVRPEFQVEDAARQLRVHRTTVYRLCREALGISPQAYVQRLRTQRGIDLLADASLTIAEAARAAGFADPEYFGRITRRLTGHSPKELRRMMGG